MIHNIAVAHMSNFGSMFHCTDAKHKPQLAWNLYQSNAFITIQVQISIKFSFISIKFAEHAPNRIEIAFKNRTVNPNSVKFE